MSVEYQDVGEDELFFLCDTCGEESEIGDNFHSLWNHLRDEGWRAYNDGEWQHSCPQCVENWARKQR